MNWYINRCPSWFFFFRVSSVRLVILFLQTWQQIHPQKIIRTVFPPDMTPTKSSFRGRKFSCLACSAKEPLHNKWIDMAIFFNVDRFIFFHICFSTKMSMAALILSWLGAYCTSSSCTTMYYNVLHIYPPEKIEKYNPTQEWMVFWLFYFFGWLIHGYPLISANFSRFFPCFSGRRHCSLHPRSGAPEADGQCHGPGLATCELPSGDAEDTATGWQVGEHWWNIWDIYGIYIYIYIYIYINKYILLSHRHIYIYIYIEISHIYSMFFWDICDIYIYIYNLHWWFSINMICVCSIDTCA